MAPSIDLGGYAEVRASWALGAEGTAWSTVERVRPRFRAAPAERVTVEVVPEVAFAQGRDPTHEAAGLLLASPVGDVLEAGGCTYVRPPRYDTVSDYVSVERLHVDLNLPAADLTIGRQAVTWGSGLAFRPSDLYAEVVFTEPWRERRGVNALKVAVPAGPHSVTALLAVDDDLSPVASEAPALPGSAALKGTLNVAGMDLSALGAGTYRPGALAADGLSRADGAWSSFVGADLRGTFGVGWWVEGGWYVDEDAPDVVLGIDYSFPVLQNLYVAAEARWDGTGAAPGDYDLTSRVGAGLDPSALGLDCALVDALAGQAPPAATSGRARMTLGRRYADAVLRLGVTEEVNVSAVALANLDDGSMLVVPAVSANLGARTTVNVGAQVPAGAAGEFHPDADLLTASFGTTEVDLSGLVPSATLLAWARAAF
jgi:hypothetical protein